MTTQFGTFDQLIADVTPNVAAIMQLMREIIHQVHSQPTEVIRLGERTIAFGIGPKKMSEAYAYLQPHGDYLNLGFYHGTAIDDPDNLLQGTGKALRHVKLYTPEDAANPAIKQLIQSSLLQRRVALGRTNEES
jgi:hypothetical protein